MSIKTAGLQGSRFTKQHMCFDCHLFASKGSEPIVISEAGVGADRHYDAALISALQVFAICVAEHLQATPLRDLADGGRFYSVLLPLISPLAAESKVAACILWQGTFLLAVADPTAVSKNMKGLGASLASQMLQILLETQLEVSLDVRSTDSGSALAVRLHI